MAFGLSYVTYKNTFKHASERVSFDVTIMELFEKYTSNECESGLSDLCRGSTKTLESILEKNIEMLKSERTYLDPDDYKRFRMVISEVESEIARLHEKITIDDANNQIPNQLKSGASVVSLK